ncbi:MAG: hypothetical protein U0R70_17535 [Solirubrobacteraceae bacterium]
MLVRLAAAAGLGAFGLALPAHAAAPAPSGPCAPGSVPAAKLFARDAYAPTPTATHEVGVAVGIPDPLNVSFGTITLPAGIKKADMDDWPRKATALPDDPTIDSTFGLIVDRAQTLPIHVSWVHSLEDRRGSPTCTASTALALTLSAPATGPRFSRVRVDHNQDPFGEDLVWSLPEMNRATADLRPLTLELRAGSRTLRRRGTIQTIGFRESAQPFVKPLVYSPDELVTTFAARTHTSYRFRLAVAPGPHERRSRYEIVFRRTGTVFKRIRLRSFCGRNLLCSFSGLRVTNR